jgi:hypothetical protein
MTILSFWLEIIEDHFAQTNCQVGENMRGRQNFAHGQFSYGRERVIEQFKSRWATHAPFTVTSVNWDMGKRPFTIHISRKPVLTLY